MVPVNYPPTPPLPENLNVPVWYIPQTQEWFLDYDSYLSRLDYYNIRKFVCEITGNSCLTYFDAYKSEIHEIALLKKYFPEHLKEPILRRIQFSTIARIDQLVDYVYTEFKNDYYPGETVYVRPNKNNKDLKLSTSGGKLKCIIREKTLFNGLTLPDGTTKSSYAKYSLVSVDNQSQKIICGDDEIFRDRNQFTKTFARTFIKLCMTKYSSKIGAPWIVKQEYADRYRIPTELPAEFAQFKESAEDVDNEGVGSVASGSSGSLLSGNVAIAPKLKKLKPLTAIRPKEGSVTGAKAGMLKLVPAKTAKSKSTAGTPSPSGAGVKKQTAKSKKDPSALINILTDDADSKTATPNTATSQPQVVLPPPPPPPTIKEDLSYPLATQPPKPQPTTLTNLGPYTAASLSLWTFLNIYRSPLVLDTFTYDDFLTALCWNTSSVRCELLDEIFCSVLSAFMPEGGEKNGIVLPEEFERGEDWGKMIREFEEGVKRGEDVKKLTETFEEENEDEEDEKKDSFDYNSEDRVEEYLKYRNTHWTTRLSKRQYKEGNWQIILLGLLDELRHYKPFAESITTILSILAPKDSSVNPQTIQDQFFKHLPVELRLRSLEILTTVLVNTPLIRTFLESTMEQSAQLRRERMDCIRDYKAIYEKAQDVDRECRVFLEKLVAENQETTEPANGDAAGEEAKDSKDVATDENVKKRRRTGLKVALTAQETSLSATNSVFKALLDQRTSFLQEAESIRTKKKVIEKTLNEIDIQRFVCLGRDRYFNKYWWFENNGLPSVKGKKSRKRTTASNATGTADKDDEEEDEGMDDVSDDESDGEDVEDETYLMGRLWVQGPSVEDVVHGLKLAPEDVEKYVKKDSLEEVLDEEDDEDEEHESMMKHYRLVPSENSIDDAKIFSNIEESHKIKFNPESPEVLDITNADSPETIIDTTGATNTEATITPFVRKLIEETPQNLLLSPEQWKQFTTTAELESLLTWLNPWGKRESTLFAALSEVRDQMEQSFDARRRALRVDSLEKEEIDLKSQISEIVISDTEPESEGQSSSEEEYSSEGEEIGDQRRTRRLIAQSQLSELKRREREERNLAKAMRSKPSARIQRRENRKRQKIAHRTKRTQKKELQNKLHGLRVDNIINRVLGWVNSSAVEKLGQGHYEGVKRVVAANGKSRKGRK
ncbi:hypothetical protein WICPIJ_006934 [Wickerhamomyces pijperi]|uniref:WAC domain-containing protein n=1 Tax=Wickerhamomyces pijperi TaxID=599730 RepID=A0A9P8TJQ7_WICPI|nr:hypothetical protein WICPIJ_006934 [Wickerhamomyces pijperi]